MKWLMSLWYRRLRRIDIECLWPACRGNSNNIAHARAAFACHAYHDKAWLPLSAQEIDRIIEELV